jgi:hypothetical protein
VFCRSLDSIPIAVSLVDSGERMPLDSAPLIAWIVQTRIAASQINGSSMTACIAHQAASALDTSGPHHPDFVRALSTFPTLEVVSISNLHKADWNRCWRG